MAGREELVAGRILEGKRAAHAAIARNVKAAFGIGSSSIGPSDPWIVLEQIDRENWGINGKPAGEL